VRKRKLIELEGELSKCRKENELLKDILGSLEEGVQVIRRTQNFLIFKERREEKVEKVQERGIEACLEGVIRQLTPAI